MAKLEFQLEHGIPFGKGKDKEMQYDVVLRELTTADVIDARKDSENVVFVPDEQGNGKGITVVSEVTMGLELVRRQVESVGEMKGPLSMNQLRAMHLDDFALLNEHAEKLDQATEVIAKRGRLEQSSNES